MARVSDLLSGSPTPQAVRAHQIHLQLADLFGGNANAGQFAETGVDSVGGLAGSDQAINHRARSVHAFGSGR